MISEKENLLDRAIEAFHENIDGFNLNIQFKIDLKEINKLDSLNYSPDAKIQIKADGHKKTFFAVIKKQITLYHINQIQNQMNLSDQKWMVIADYISNPVKDSLTKKKIYYLESTGNCYLETDSTMIYINDKGASKVRDNKEGKIWKTAGLKFLFTVLNNPDLINEPYREIAELAGISLGTIGKFIDELLKDGYLKTTKKNKKTQYFFDRKMELIEKWSTFYASVLRPKLSLGAFRALNTKPKDFLLDTETLWGGESAGAELTKYLTPEKYTLYTWKNKSDLIKELKLVPDPKGPIELFQAFWKKGSQSNDSKYVPSILIYADLMATNDSRNYETALRIKDTYFGI